jgi:prolyl oligopeptidase
MVRPMRTLLVCVLVACSSTAPQPTGPAPAQPPVAGEPAAAPAAPAAKRGDPAAPRGTVSETHHGTAVADPYRWLEEMDSPATKAFVTAANQQADAYFAGVPARAQLRTRIEELMSNEKYGMPQQRGGRYYWTYHDGRKPQVVVMMAPSLTDAGKVILDGNELSSDGSLTFAGFVPSERAVVAYGVAKSGGDWRTWRFRDVTTGRDLPEELAHNKYYRPVFTADGSGVYYSRFPAPKPGTELAATDRDCKVYFHKLGTPVDQDRVVYERPDHPTWQFSLEATPDQRYLVISIGDGQVGDSGQEQIAYLELAKPAAKPTPLIESYDAEYELVGSDGPVLFFKTTLDAPNRRIIAIDLRAPARAKWKTIIPAGPLAISAAGAAGKQLYVSALKDAHTVVTAYDLKGTKLRDVELPGIGTAFGFRAAPAAKETFYVFTSSTTPVTVYRHELATAKATAWRAPKLAYDPSAFETTQVFFPSKDGTKVPMFVTAKKGLPHDGKRPTIMTAYGFGGVPSLPVFDAPGVAWLERGGVSVLVNIRGGGEYGEAWHEAAKKLRRQTGIDDFIAAGEWLIANRYTSAAHLGAIGGSGGGMLVAMVEVQRPELFGAVIPLAGVHDLLRFHLFGQGAGWQADLGSPDEPNEFALLHKLSPLHNVRPGTRYPATLVVTADTDVRVAPLHSYKYAAALQHAQAGDAPIVLRVETRSGHSGGGTLAQKIDQRADVMSFFARNLGLE